MSVASCFYIPFLDGLKRFILGEKVLEKPLDGPATKESILEPSHINIPVVKDAIKPTFRESLARRNAEEVINHLYSNLGHNLRKKMIKKLMRNAISISDCVCMVCESFEVPARLCDNCAQKLFKFVSPKAHITVPSQRTDGAGTKHAGKGKRVYVVVDSTPPIVIDRDNIF